MTVGSSRKGMIVLFLMILLKYTGSMDIVLGDIDR